MPARASAIGRLLLPWICLALFAGGLIWREVLLLPDGQLHVSFLDVGQGDSALIVTPGGRRVLIDGGPDWSALERLGEQLPFFDRHIDLMELTHPHQDHLASYPYLLERVPVGAFLMAGTPYALGRYQNVLEDLRDRRIAVLGPDAGVIHIESGVTLSVLWPPPETFGAQVNNVNIASVVTMLEYKGRRVLFTGDIEEITEREMLRRGIDVRADVLKVPHHGSSGSSSAPFLRAVGAGIAVISSGSGNVFHHPRPDALARLAAAGMVIRRTDTEGTIDLAW